MILTQAEVDAIRAQAEREYPAECCGVVLLRADGDRRLFPCRNIQDAKRAEDPERFPRDARTAYYMHPDDVVAFSRMDWQSYHLHVIYHSHVDAGAYFSETDRSRAMEFGIDGQPAYPDATYVVVAVHGRRAGEVRAFRWEAERRQFAEVNLPVG